MAGKDRKEGQKRDKGKREEGSSPLPTIPVSATDAQCEIYNRL